jgi:hypothetical protein
MTKKIVAVAIHYNGMIHTIPAPARHCDVLNSMRAYGEKIVKWNEAKQGFMDADGKFLNRQEAYDRAIEHNQLLPNHGNEGGKHLFSEDVW